MAMYENKDFQKWIGNDRQKAVAQLNNLQLRK